MFPVWGHIGVLIWETTPIRSRLVWGPGVRDSIGSPTPYPICADKGHNRERSQGDMIGGLGKVYKGEIGVVLVRCMEGSAPREG